MNLDFNFNGDITIDAYGTIYIITGNYEMGYDVNIENEDDEYKIVYSNESLEACIYWIYNS